MKTGRKGFTLVEALVAVTVGALLLGTMIELMRAVRVRFDRGDASLKAAVLARATVERLRGRLAADPGFLREDGGLAARTAVAMPPELSGDLEAVLFVQPAHRNPLIPLEPGWLRVVTVVVRERRPGARPALFRLGTLVRVPPESFSLDELADRRHAFQAPPPFDRRSSFPEHSRLALPAAMGALAEVGHWLTRVDGAAPGLPPTAVYPPPGAPRRPLALWQNQLATPALRSAALRRGYVRVLERTLAIQLDAYHRARRHLQVLVANHYPKELGSMDNVWRDLKRLNGLLQRLPHTFTRDPALASQSVYPHLQDSPQPRHWRFIEGWEADVRRRVSQVNAQLETLGYPLQLAEILASRDREPTWQALEKLPERVTATLSRLIPALEAMARDPHETPQAQATAALRLVEALTVWELATPTNAPDLSSLAPRLGGTFVASAPDLARWLGGSAMPQGSLNLERHLGLAHELRELGGRMPRHVPGRLGEDNFGKLRRLRETIKHPEFSIARTIEEYRLAQELLQGIYARPLYRTRVLGRDLITADREQRVADQEHRRADQNRRITIGTSVMGHVPYGGHYVPSRGRN